MVFPVRADIVYRDDNFENNFIPLGSDGAADRPIPGDRLGNQISLASIAMRNVVSATVEFACGNDGNEPLVTQTDTYALTIYLNDGPDGQPMSIIGNSSVLARDDSVFAVTFPFNNLLVPDAFTAVVSSTHPTDTFSSSQGLVGPMSTTDAPDIGSGINAVWSDAGQDGADWVSNTTWAIDDGATTNYFNMSLIAVPEPALPLASLSLPLLLLSRRRYSIERSEDARPNRIP